MVDDVALRDQRLTLVWRLHELMLDLADISEIVPQARIESLIQFVLRPYILLES